jgi:hypothetical protein
MQFWRFVPERFLKVFCLSLPGDEFHEWIGETWQRMPSKMVKQ